jgi:hypothetical protein
MVPTDVLAVNPVVARAFFDGEPTMRCAGATERDISTFVDMFLPRMAAEGNTIIAVDKTTQAVLGAFMNEDFCNPDPAGLDTFLAHVRFASHRARRSFRVVRRALRASIRALRVALCTLNGCTRGP